MVDDINAKIELDGAQFLRTLNKIISGLADLPRESAAATAAIDKLEKQAVGLAAAFSKSTGAIVGQKAAVESLITSYNKLGLASLKGAGNLTRELQSAFKLAGGTTLADQFGLRPLSQDLKNAAGTIRTMNSLYEQQNRIRLAGARAVNGADMPDKAGFLAAQKRNQQAAYQSYQSNIAYSKSIADVNNGLANQRYALYDVASSLAVVSLATLGAAAISLKFAIDYEKNFANVARTTGATRDELANLRAQLIDLSTTLPTSFQDITEIATLGAQLGVATEGIDEFTEVVAKLAATTNLTSEAAGTALGRFDALFKDIDPSKFKALGSAILKVGVNTVATESQIVNTSVQISSMGDFAGFTAEQVIGLSGALASVGAQPELARGTITRVFTLMSTAVSSGGDALAEFARISGTSAENFKAAWGTPQFASVFQNFLKGIETEGQGAISTLNDLGVSSVRDVPLLLRLAGAGDVVKKSFDSAATGFADGTELNKQYAITADTVAAKLTILGNTLKAILESPSSAALGPLAGLLDGIEAIVKGVLMLAQTDAGKVLGIITLSLITLVGVMTGLKTIQALVTASSYAFITAQASLEKQGLGSSTAMGALTKQMLMFTVGTTRATAASAAFTAATNNGVGRIGALTAGLKGATGAAGGLASAGRAAMVSFGWLAAIGVGLSVLTSFAAKNQEAKARVDSLTESLDANTGAITLNTEEQIKNIFTQDGTLAKARELGISWDVLKGAALGNRDAVAELTAKYEAWNAIASQPVNYDQTFDEEVEAQAAAVDAAASKADAFSDILSAVGVTSDEVAEAQRNQRYASDGAADAMAGEAQSAQELVGELQDILDAQYQLVGGTVAVQNALYGLGSSLGENGLDFNAYSVAGRANLAALQQALSTMVTASGGDAAALATMVAGLMQSLAAMGVDTVNQLGFVQQALAQLTGGKGVGSLPGVGNAAAQAGNALGQGFSVGAGKAAKAANRAAKGAGGAAKEIKTLTDYVSDLSGVFKNAFDIRFGMEKSVDGVADAYSKLSDYAADAAESVSEAVQAIRQADADIQSLNAANTTLNYQLVVAQEYGDTLRANEILAEIAENNADIADKQDDRAKSGKDLAKANNSLNKSLDGTTAESREQRDMVLGLTESYQAQILALSNSGLSQAEVARRTQELRNQFVAQLTQLGYNRAEIERYARSFDDLTQAILRVPRNITVTADTNPAQRAIDEFMARNANRTANVGTNLSVPDGGSTYGLGASAGAAYADGWNAQMQARRRLMVQADGSVPGGKRYSTDGGQTWFLQKGGRVGKGRQPEYHSKGGVHGLGFKPRGTDTTPAMLTPGEHVTQKPAVDYYGLPFFNAINSMQFPKYLATGTSGSSGGGGSAGYGPQLVELMPSQLQQLAALLSTTLSLDGKMITGAVNNENAISARRGSN